jgi:hypothetical protein
MYVHLASCGRISWRAVSELKIERSVRVSIQLKIESVKEILSLCYRGKWLTVLS